MATRPTKPSRTAGSGRPEGSVSPAAPADHPAAEPADRPVGLRLAAAALMAEAVGLCVAGAFAAAATAAGRSYQFGSGIALTVIAFGTGAMIAALAVGVAMGRPWSRIPAVMTQFFVVIVGLTLLDGHRHEWGLPALVLAGVVLVGLLTPASLRALNRPPAGNQPRP